MTQNYPLSLLLSLAEGKKTTDGCLRRLLQDQIIPTEAQRGQASTSQQFLRQQLKDAQNSIRNFPWLMAGDFLGGSYARFTKIRPLDDVDLYVPMDGTGLTASTGGSPVGTVDNAGSLLNPISRGVYNDEYGNVDSRRILNAFRDAVQDAYPDTTKIVRDGQAVNVWLKSYDLGLDVVPCFKVFPFTGGEQYYIPVGKNQSHWLVTNPKIDADHIQSLDDVREKLFRPIVRLVKYWNREKNAGRLKSYHLETLCYNCFFARAIPSLVSGLCTFFLLAADYIKAPCPDPKGLGDNLDTYLEAGNRDASVAAAQEASVNCCLAYLADEKGDVTQAIAELQKVLGDKLEE